MEAHNLFKEEFGHILGRERMIKSESRPLVRGRPTMKSIDTSVHTYSRMASSYNNPPMDKALYFIYWQI